MTYLGNAVSQLDSSLYAHHNCVLAASVTLADTSSLDYWNLKAAQLRIITGDTDNGIVFSDATAAVKKATNGEVEFSILYGAPQTATESTLDDLLDAPRAVIIAILCSVTRYTPYRTGTYTGRHAVAVGAKRFITVTRPDGTKYQQKQAYVMDPGHTNAAWVWWPWELLIKAGMAVAGAGKIHVMYTRDLEDIDRPAKDTGAIRSAPVMQNSPSNKVGSLVKGKNYPVLQTLEGGSWVVNGHTGKGWNKIGTNRFVNGGKLR